MANASVKPKKAKQRLARRIDAYEKFVTKNKGNTDGFKRPGSLKK